MKKQLREQKQQHTASAEQSIHEISDEDLQSVGGGRQRESGYTFRPSRNNPTAGDIHDSRGKCVGIRIGDSACGPV